MITAGIDVGSVASKAAIMADGSLLSYSVYPTGIDVSQVAWKVLNEALNRAKLTFKDIDGSVATGYGRINIPFATKQMTEITCSARGVNHFYPKAKIVIDVGGQDTKVIKLGDRGRVKNFAMNDKCAAGTGRFLEVAAQTLGIGVEELGKLSLEAKEPCQISSTCTVFAQTEIVSLIARKVAIENIIAGLHKAIANRVFGLACSLNPEGMVVMTGGVARNIGVVRALQDKIGVEIYVPENPEILTAVGAALLGQA